MRTLKPEFWTDEVIVELSFAARLFYQGCWNFAICDRGHLDDSPKSLKLKILPADDVDPVELINELIEHGRVLRKTLPDGRTYLHIPTLSRHDKVDTRWNTRCLYCATESRERPVSAPPSSDDLAGTPVSSGEASETPEKAPSRGRGIRRGKGEGEGEVAESTSRSARTSRARASRIPDDFAVTPEMVDWAKARAPNVDGRRETEKFVNYWRSKAGSGATKLDWPATWRNWMLTAQTDAESNGARASPANRQLVERDGLQLKPETAARVDARQRFAAMDAAKDTPAIEGPR